MRDRHWIDWNRRDLSGQEAQELLASLTLEQRHHLAKEDFVWSPATGVIFRDPEGRLHRARFTHGTHFRTRRGEFYIDSAGQTSQCSAVPRSRVRGKLCD